MPPTTFRMLFVMDPLEGEDFAGSTTIAIMQEAGRRGHELLYADLADLSVVAGRPFARVTPVTLPVRDGDASTSSIEWGKKRSVDLDAEVDVAFQRKDPPVDADYIAATQILGLCRRTLVLNRPNSILAYNEKLFALHFRDLMPESSVSRRIADLRAFMEKAGGEMIVKPLDGKGGEGIFHLRQDDRNLSSILEQATAFESRWVMAQRYLPAIRQGDKRILLLEGEVLGAVLRVPADSEVRANLHVGASAARAEIDSADERIIAALAPELRREGLFFVGIDVIGGLLTEINVTSPTGVQEINTIENVCLQARLLDRVEQRIAERARA